MKKIKINWFRVFFSSSAVCAVMGIMLYIHTHQVQDILSKIAEEGNLANVEWLVKYLTCFLPVVPVVIALTVFYSVFKDDPATVHKEKMIATVALIVFTYALLLPVIASKKGPVGESEKTMLDITINWFAFQAVPMLVMLLYHSSMTEDEPEVTDASTTAVEGEESHEDEKEKE